MGKTLLAALSLLFVGCTAAEDPTGPTGEDELDPSGPAVPETPETPETPEEPQTPSRTWLNQPVPFVAHFHDVTVTFRIDQTTAIDGLIGLADGKVVAFKDLGPSLRLDAAGQLQAIDGDTYRADTAVSYLGGPVEVLLKIDLERHHYSVEANGVALATNYKFGTLQADLSRIDTFATSVETPDATLTVTDVELGPEWCSLAGQSWVNLYHPSQTGKYRIAFEAQVPADVTDAYVGLAARDATSTADLHGAVRFAANAQLHARDGQTYRADNAFAYAADTYYQVSLEVDTAAQVYSVVVDGAPLATNYAFSGAPPALSQLGLFATTGYIRLCDLTVWDY